MKTHVQVQIQPGKRCEYAVLRPMYVELVQQGVLTKCRDTLKKWAYEYKCFLHINPLMVRCVCVECCWQRASERGVNAFR